MNSVADSAELSLSPEELAKRAGLAARKPYVAAKLARITQMEARGEVSPIIRIEKSYLCNFQCSHCCAEPYMDRHLEKVLKIVDTREKMNIDDVRRLSEEADALGLARFVITGGEPLVMKDFDDVVAAIDPEKHYIVTDTNGWFLDAARAKHLKSIGVEKVQLSLDSFIEHDHDTFRNKPGSYKRVMRAIDACCDAGLNLILSTVLVKGRALTQEFRDLCRFSTERNIGLYVSYAKPSGAGADHPEFVITKEDADVLRDLERSYKVFTHMTPSYGSFKGCITVKGIITVTSTMEVTPCPYIDFSLGNLRETPLKEILARGMRNRWLGPHRPDCVIGEDPDFIKIHTERTKLATFLPIPWGQGFSEDDQIERNTTSAAESLFDSAGRCVPQGDVAAHATSRRYFSLKHPIIDYQQIVARTGEALGGTLPDAEEFALRTEAIRRDLSLSPETRDILNGICVPFVLPQAEHEDIGAALDARYLPAVRRAFTSALPNFAFTNHCKSSLAGNLSVAAGARHERLISAMRAGYVVGCYFPCLLEYSVPAARAQIAKLSEKFLLAGGFDTCAAFIAAPDLLLREDGYPPLLWLAGLAGADADTAYHFEAYGHDLTFNRRAHLGQMAEYWASSLVVLG